MISLPLSQFKRILAQFSLWHVHELTGQYPTYDIIHSVGSLDDDKSGMFGDVLGKVLTMLEAVLPDKTQLNSAKSMARDYLRIAARRAIADFECTINYLTTHDDAENCSWSHPVLNDINELLHPRGENSCS